MSAASDSETPNFTNNIPLTAVSSRTQCLLSQMLNSTKIFRSDEGFQRDWRGLAALALPKYTINECSINDEDPASMVFKLWLKNNPITATFDNLEKYLGLIDRWDIFDDVYEDLVQDALKYQTEQEQRNQTQEVDTNNATQANMPDPFHALNNSTSNPSILTKDDVLQAQKGQPLQRYDAFILYADADIDYAKELLNKVENNAEYKFKLCTKDRDLLAGISFEHVAVTQLIEERCKHLIIILTKQFLWSPENTFLVNYTQAYQIRRTIRKIIPLLYDEDIEIPRTLKIYTHLRYNASPSNSLFNFWSKLTTSILDVHTPRKTSLTTSTCQRISSLTPATTETGAITTTTTTTTATTAAATTVTTTVPDVTPDELQSNLPESTNSTNLIVFQSNHEDASKNEFTSQINTKLQQQQSLEDIKNHDGISNTHETKYYTSNAICQFSDPPSSVPGTVDSEFYSISNNQKSDKVKIKEKKRWPIKILKNVFNRKQRTVATIV